MFRILSSGKPEAQALCASLRRMCTESSKPPTPAEPNVVKPARPVPEVSHSPAPVYTSAATPSPPSQPVGPGADKAGAYPNTEYYTYNKLSYFDLELEMSPHRIPQPAADNGRF